MQPLAVVHHPSTTSRGYQWTLITHTSDRSFLPLVARCVIVSPGASGCPDRPTIGATPGAGRTRCPATASTPPHSSLPSAALLSASNIELRPLALGTAHKPFRPLGRYDAVLIAASAQPPPRVCPGRSAGSFAYSPQQPPLRTSSFQHPASPTGRSRSWFCPLAPIADQTAHL